MSGSLCPTDPAFGGLFTGVQVTDGFGFSGTPDIGSTSDKWGYVLAGWYVTVNGGASGGKQLVTTVLSVTDSGHIILAANLGSNISGALITIYPDDTAALDACFAAAGAAGVDVILPNGALGGYANPGSWTVKTLQCSLLLNGAHLMLGQDGQTTDTGVGLSFAKAMSGVQGPGTIEGGYQNNQGIEQSNPSAVAFTSGTNWNSVTGNVRIINTKGRAVSAAGVGNFTLADTFVMNCGDYAYFPSSGDPFAGRSNGVQCENIGGFLTVRNLTGFGCAQSGLLVSNFANSNQLTIATISDCHFSGNGYFGIDLEDVYGPVLVSNCGHMGDGTPASGTLIKGGMIIRDVRDIQVNNFSSLYSDGQALTLVNNGAGINWSLSNINLRGTLSGNAAQLSISYSSTTPVPTQRISLSHVRYDVMSLYANGPACDCTNPEKQILAFDDVRASRLYPGSYDTQVPTQANAGTMTYWQATNSDLGKVNIQTLGPSNKSLYFDWTGVRTNGPLTFAGGSTSSIASGAIASMPSPNNPGNNSFSCP